MGIGWRDIAFRPEPTIAAEAGAAWSWLVGEPWTPLLCAMVGGIFLETRSGAVRWLDTATGLVEDAAASAAEFDALCKAGGDEVDLWFLPGLVEDLHQAGKRPADGDCYGFNILPVFEEGKFVPENMFVVPVREQFVGLAAFHKQLSELSPEATQVRVEVRD